MRMRGDPCPRRHPRPFLANTVFDGYDRWVREAWVRKELTFWQNHAPNCDFYESSTLSTSQLDDGWVRHEG
jgi:hypothetical protein